MNEIERARRPEELNGLSLDLRYDSVFKAVFADEADPRSRAALSGLLSAITERGLSVECVLQNEPVTDFLGEKQIRYDINCVCTDNTRCNVEMTLHPLPCEAVRIEYYADKAHVGQESKGIRYNDLVPTYHVSILNETMFTDGECLHVFDMHDSVRNVSLGGRVRIFTAELPKVKALAQRKPVREMTPAERWAAYFLYNADESAFARTLVNAIKEEEEAVKMAAEVMREYTADEKRYYRLLSEMKYELDHFNRMAEAEERGRADEREKAEAERAAMMNALRAAGISEEIIEKACKDVGLKNS